MYYTHFGLKQAPFKITPNTEFFFSGGNRGAVLDALIYAVNSGEGIIKVVGEVGSGKTMLCRMLQTLLPEKVESVYLANPSVAPEDVLHAIAFELQLKLPAKADRLQVLHVLQNYLLERHAAGKQVVIFVEEAQGMPLATLEEIRLLSNLETKNDKLLQIVLFGQPELDINLNETQIRQLRERITQSFNLGPLDEKEIGEYLIFRLRAAGYFGPHLFSNAAIRRLSKAARGLVRRVNILADKSLLAAFSDNVYQVTPWHVRAAIKDSEFDAEHSKREATRPIYWAISTTLVVGLGLGYLLNQWSAQTASLASESKAPKPAMNKIAVTQAEVKDTVVSSTKDASIHAGPAVLPAPEPDDILGQRLAATQNWLKTKPVSTISIQLMGGADQEQLKQQLETLAMQLEVDNLYIFRTQARGKQMATILYGSYADRDDAIHALQKLPVSLRSNHPQLRTVGGIQEETKLLQ